MKAHLIPVGVDGLEEDRAVQVDVRTYTEVLADNQRLERLWREDVDLRISYQVRLSKASRVLASLGRLSPQMASVVEAARREVYGRLP